MFPRNQIDRCDVAEDDKDLADDGKNHRTSAEPGNQPPSESRQAEHRVDGEDGSEPEECNRCTEPKSPRGDQRRKQYRRPTALGVPTFPEPEGNGNAERTDQESRGDSNTGPGHDGPQQEPGRSRQQTQPNRIDRRARSGGSITAQKAKRQNQCDQSKRHVENEKQPPSEVGVGILQQNATEDRSGNAGQTTRGAVRAQRLRPSLSGHPVGDDAEHLRTDGACADPLPQPGQHDHRRIRRTRSEDSHHRENAQARQEQASTPDDVTESARRHQGQAESQRIARKDPLHLRGRRA
ncbi:transmembrane transport [Ascochyta rabiei]|uniref:Transmembrane transport n=1 Tax=Didymella rabiei TaxID=5454 RepID=A0A163LB77_DIDRA|nr:transmembrane transport [Ascochyta rabiei]